MNQVAVVPNPNHLATVGQAGAVEAWTTEREEFIRKQFCGGAPDDKVSVFLEVARGQDLRPERREIYFVKRGDGWSIQTGIDGYRKIAHRTGQCAGIDDPVYDTEDGKHPNRATVTVWRFVQGVRVPFTATARWSEYCPRPPADQMWNKMPWLMLGKCAEALAIRKAFSSEIGPVYSDAEMDQADGNFVDVEGRVVDRSTGEIHETPRRGKPTAPEPITAKAIAALEAVAGKRQMDGGQLLALACTRYKVSGLDDLTVDQGRALYRFLDKAPDGDLDTALSNAGAISAPAVNDDELQKVIDATNAAHPVNR